MAVKVDVQRALNEASTTELPDDEQIQQWATVAIDTALDLKNNLGGQEKYRNAQMTVRIVEEVEICRLNENFRHKVGATNVLSFPFVSPPGIPADETFNLLGDLVVCAAVVGKEAKEQRKTIIAHWAHMIAHGTLHLLGYDHQAKEETFEMESLEKKIMSGLGFPEPYGDV